MLKILLIWRDQVLQSIRTIEDRWEITKLHKINILDNYDTKGLELLTYVIIDIFHNEYLIRKLNNELD